MSQTRNSRYNQKNQDENLDDFGKIQGIKRVSSALQKKSFSCMLKECTNKKNKESLNPIMHE